jgi:hypothetical protein
MLHEMVAYGRYLAWKIENKLELEIYCEIVNKR